MYQKNEPTFIDLPPNCCLSAVMLILSSKLLDLERKTRLEPAFAGISRELYLHPQPLEGGSGVVRASHRVKRKKQPVWTAFLSLLLQAKPPLSTLRLRREKSK